MNRTDRMLAIMLHLQSRRYTRGEDLAERFEISVRTVYRDVQALDPMSYHRMFRQIAGYSYRGCSM